MREVLDNSFQNDILSNLEYIMEKKESERLLTDFERFLYGFAYNRIISSKMANSSVVPAMSLSIAFLGIVLYKNRNKGLIKIGMKSLLALNPIIGIAVSDLRNGKPPFSSIKNPLLKIGAYLLTGIVTGPMYIAYKIIPEDKMKKFFETIDTIKSKAINKILSMISGQDIHYDKIYNEVRQEILQLEVNNKDRRLRALKQKVLVLQNDNELGTKSDKSLQINEEKPKQLLNRINTNGVDLSTKKQEVVYSLG